MKTILLKPVLVMAGASLLMTGCVVRERTVYRSGPPPATYVGPEEVEVSSEPPPPVEVESSVGLAPGPDFVWVPGFYVWGAGGWVWTHGRWDHPPRPGLRWYGPRVVVRGGGHRVWVRGGWR